MVFSYLIVLQLLHPHTDLQYLQHLQPKVIVLTYVLKLLNNASLRQDLIVQYSRIDSSQFPNSRSK